MSLTDFLTTLDLRPSSLSTYQSHVRRITQALGDPGACSFAQIEAWWHAHPLGPVARKTDLGLIRAYLRWRRLHGLPGPDLEDWRPRDRRAPDEAGRALTREEAARFVGALEGPLRDVVVVALLSGLRRSNLLPTKWKPGLLACHFDLEVGEWRVPGELMKAGRRFEVPMHPLVCSTLSAKISPERAPGLRCTASGGVHEGDETPETLTGHARGLPEPIFDLRDPRRALASAWARSGGSGPAPGWHDLRRTFATWLAEAGAGPFVIAKLMAHKPLGVTGLYVRPEREEMLAALDGIRLRGI